MWSDCNALLRTSWLRKEKLKEQEKEKGKMGPPEDMTVRLLKEVLDESNVTYKANEKKADLIDKFRHVRATLQEESYNSEKANVFPSSEHTDTKRDNCFHFKKSPDVCFILFYDDQKELLLHLLYHILFLLETVGIYLEVLVLQQIMSAIIAIFVTVSNQLWVLTSFIKLLCVWMALIFSWLVAQVNFMSVLGENIVQI